jgi:hypothetical protein
MIMLGECNMDKGSTTLTVLFSVIGFIVLAAILVILINRVRSQKSGREGYPSERAPRSGYPPSGSFREGYPSERAPFSGREGYLRTGPLQGSLPAEKPFTEYLPKNYVEEVSTCPRPLQGLSSLPSEGKGTDHGLTIHNYLELPLTAIYLHPDGKREQVLHKYIRPERQETIPWVDINLQKGGKIRFIAIREPERRDSPHRAVLRNVASSKPIEEDIFYDYLITDPKEPDIHVGMVTTKKLNYLSPTVFGGGSHEITQLWIHNRGKVPLSFNGHINVPAGETIIYDGTGSFAPSGVSIGSSLKNDNGYYGDLLIDRKISDVYYGVISKKSLPVYQGSQYPPYLVPTA